MNAEEKKKYMREYRRRARSTPEGRAKLRAEKARWKKSANGKKYNRNWAKKKYVPSTRVLKTREEHNARRLNYYHTTHKPKRLRKHRENMEHLKRYGLNKEQYLIMLAEQGGGCAICGSTNGSNKNPRVMCVDHCHETGKVRGLLCDPCNRGLGCLKDDVGIVRRAALYLEASK